MKDLLRLLDICADRFQEDVGPSVIRQIDTEDNFGQCCFFKQFPDRRDSPESPKSKTSVELVDCTFKEVEVG